MKALTECVRLIASHDYPDRWANLDSEFTSRLLSGNPQVTLVTLQLLERVAWHFHLKHIPGGGPMAGLSSSFLPYLAQLTTTIVDGNHNVIEAGKALHLSLKIYYRLIHQRFMDYPAVHSNPESFVRWCGIFDRVLKRPLPEGEPEEESDRIAWPWYKAKKWAMKILYRLACRWGRKDLLDSDHQNYNQTILCSDTFHAHVAPSVTETTVSILLAWSQNTAWSPPALRLYCIKFIESACDFSSVWRPLRPHLPMLVGCIFPALLKQTQDDIELFETDPASWMSNQDNFETFYNDPKSAVAILMHDLLTKKNRKKHVWPIIDSYFAETLTAYAQAPIEARDISSKEVIMRILYHCSRAFRQDKAHRQALPAFLEQHITPELSSPIPYLRVRALQVWSTYIEMKGISKKQKTVATNAVLAALTDASMPVRYTAAAILSGFILASEEAREIIKPHVTDLIGHIFNLLDEFGYEDAVATVETLVKVYSDSLQSLAGPIAAKVGQLFHKFVANILSNEDDGTANAELDEVVMSAGGCLDIFSSLLNELLTSNNQDLAIAEVFPHLWNVITLLLSPEGQELDMVENGLDLAGDAFNILGEEKLPLVPDAWNILVQGCRFICDGNAYALVPFMLPADSCIIYGWKSNMFAGPNPATGVDYAVELVNVIGYFEGEGGQRSEDEDSRQIASKLAVSLLHHCRGQIDRVLPRIVTMYANALLNSVTMKLKKAAATVLAMALNYNALLTIQILEAAEPGLFVKIINAWSQVISTMKKTVDLKISAIGLGSIIQSATNPNFPPSFHGTLAGIVAGCLQVLHAESTARMKDAERKAKRRANRAKYELESEDEDDGPEHADDDADSYHEEEFSGEEELYSDLLNKLNDEDDDDDDDDFYDDEEDDEQQGEDGSPLDHISSTIYVVECLGELSSNTLWEGIYASLTPDAKAALPLMQEQAANYRNIGRRGGPLGPQVK